MISRVSTILNAARSLRLDRALVFPPNQGYKNRPSSIAFKKFPDLDHVRGELGSLVCPHVAAQYLVDLRMEIFEKLKAKGVETLEWLVMWPYDEGGCGCEHDWPWGSNGFPRISENIIKTYRQNMSSNPRVVLSTWMFDQPNAGEFEGLRTLVQSGNTSADYIMVDSHSDFPSFPLHHDMGRPLLNFPEISMYGRWPWVRVVS